jgi:hypothetical protein
MSQTIIYTLVEREGRWQAEIGSRKQRDGLTKNVPGIRQSFDTKKQAERWLLDQGEALKVPSLPTTLVATPTPAPLGDPIRDED